MRSNTSALEVVRERLAEAVAAKKCHACGCFQDTVEALAGTAPALGLGPVLDESRAVFAPKAYDCLGCAVCFPAVAANAFSDAFPDVAPTFAACPTVTPAVRDGWPPLPGDYHVVRFQAPVAVCTSNDVEVMHALAAAAPEGLAIVGALRTENLGIERIVANVLANPNVRRLVVCGRDVEQAVGHRPGQSLLSLFANGVDDAGRIVGAEGKRPVLKNVTREEIEAFRRQIAVVAALGETDVPRLVELVRETARSAPGPFEDARSWARVQPVTVEEPKRLVPDPAGFFVVQPDARRRRLVVEHYTNAGVLTCVLEGTTPAALCGAVAERGLVSRLDHAAYLGRELARAERALANGEPYVQDRAAGVVDEPAPSTGCGCAHGCGSDPRP